MVNRASRCEFDTGDTVLCTDVKNQKTGTHLRLQIPHTDSGPNHHVKRSAHLLCAFIDSDLLLDTSKNTRCSYQGPEHTGGILTIVSHFVKKCVPYWPLHVRLQVLGAVIRHWNHRLGAR